MRTHLKENTWIRGKFITSDEYGWGNGYVILDKGHPWYGLDYEDIPVDVHGGLTFGQIITAEDIIQWDDNLTSDDIGKYMIGFDTCHYGDSLAKWTEEKVQEEAKKLLIQCIKAINNRDKYE